MVTEKFSDYKEIKKGDVFEIGKTYKLRVPLRKFKVTIIRKGKKTQFKELCIWQGDKKEAIREVKKFIRNCVSFKKSIIRFKEIK